MLDSIFLSSLCTLISTKYHLRHDDNKYQTKPLNTVFCLLYLDGLKVELQNINVITVCFLSLLSIKYTRRNTSVCKTMLTYYVTISFFPYQITHKLRIKEDYAKEAIILLIVDVLRGL